MGSLMHAYIWQLVCLQAAVPPQGGGDKSGPQYDALTRSGQGRDTGSVHRHPHSRELPDSQHSGSVS